VYNLTVDGEHEFFANGVLVHNCDAAADGFNELTRPTEVRRAPPRVDAPYAYREG
jgi:hypothetical protein